MLQTMTLTMMILIIRKWILKKWFETSCSAAMQWKSQNELGVRQCLKLKPVISHFILSIN